MHSAGVLSPRVAFSWSGITEGWGGEGKGTGGEKQDLQIVLCVDTQRLSRSHNSHSIHCDVNTLNIDNK